MAVHKRINKRTKSATTREGATSLRDTTSFHSTKVKTNNSEQTLMYETGSTLRSLVRCNKLDI